MSFARPRHHLHIVPKPETDPLVNAVREHARGWVRRLRGLGDGRRATANAITHIIDARGFAEVFCKHLAVSRDRAERSITRDLLWLQSANVIYVVGQRKGAGGKFGAQSVVLLFNETAKELARSLGWIENSIVQRPTVGQNVRRLPSDKMADGPQDKMSDGSWPKAAKRSTAYETKSAASRACSNNIDIYQQLFEHVTAAETSNPPPTDYRSDLETAGFDDFQAIWPSWRPDEPLEPARRAFQRLSPADRLLAIRGVHAFAAAHRNSKRGPGRAVSYLKDHKWEVAKTANPVGSQVFIPEGSRRHALWLAACRREGQAAPYLIDSREHRARGFYRATPLPPAFMSIDFPSARKISKELIMSSSHLPTAANDDWVQRLFTPAPKSNPPTPYETELGHGLPTSEAELAQAVAEGRAQPAEPPAKIRAAFDSIPVVDTDLSFAELAARAVTRR